VALEQAALVCPGPELLGLEGARETVLETAGSVTAAPLDALGDIPQPEGPPALTLAPLAADPAPGDGEAPEAGVLAAPMADPTAYLALGSGSAAPGLVATQESRAEAEEVAGLATVPCRGAGPSAWVLGGGGGPGRAERLILTNPGSNAVTVDVVAYGQAGMTSPPDGQGIVVPARGRVVLLGDALAPDEASPAFHVVADGGDVTATLVETSLTGTQPTGFDASPATAEPSEEQVIAGVEVPAAEAGALVVRVLNPGQSEVIGTVAALTAAGERPIPEAVVRVPAGSVVDVAIEGLPAGPTTLAVAADAPVVAAARAFVNDRGLDGAWSVSRPPIEAVGGAALPSREGVERTLVVSARGGGATVDVVESAGGETTVTETLVPADGTVAVALGGDGVWVRRLDGTGSLYAAVVSTGSAESGAGLSAMPLTVPALSARRSEVVPLG
jgi:hypothetical protein